MALSPLTFDVSVQAVFVAVGVEVTGWVGLSVVRRLRRRVIVAHEPHTTVPTPAMLGLYTHLIFIPENQQIPMTDVDNNGERTVQSQTPKDLGRKGGNNYFRSKVLKWNAFG